MNEIYDTAILTPPAMKQFMRWYQPSDAANVTVSPLLASQFDDLSPAYFQICGRDPLRDEGLAYADALHEAKYVTHAFSVPIYYLLINEFGRIPVRVNVYSGLPHAFWIFPEISTTAVAADHLVEGVKWLLSRF